MATRLSLKLAERGWIPDHLIRLGIRRLLAKRLRNSAVRNKETARAFADQMRGQPLLTAADEANRQHYEVPCQFFEEVLGPRLKYSCGLWSEGVKHLAEAEEAMLTLTSKRAELGDGMSILELGCGWGSLSLWMAERFPNARILAISNSQLQRDFIRRRCRMAGIANLEVQTCNVAEFDTQERFDRVVSVEMFEHLRNHELMFRRAADWLVSTGKLFVHIFCHSRIPYTFDLDGDNDWMARHFFTGGMMPSYNLFAHYSKHLHIDKQWKVGGLHYSRTCEAWLKQLDAKKAVLLDLFAQDCSFRTAQIRLQRWRMFLLACSELFCYRGGNEWHVGHYLFSRCSSTTLGSRP